MIDKLSARDCYAQTKAIRCLLLRLQDDLGDLRVSRQPENRAELGDMGDKIVEIEYTLNKIQDRLAQLSREAT